MTKRKMTESKSANKPHHKITDKYWNKRHTICKTMNVSEMPDFPQLNVTEIKDLTMDVYQILFKMNTNLMPVNAKSL